MLHYILQNKISYINKKYFCHIPVYLILIKEFNLKNCISQKKKTHTKNQFINFPVESLHSYMKKKNHVDTNKFDWTIWNEWRYLPDLLPKHNMKSGSPRDGRTRSGEGEGTPECSGCEQCNCHARTISTGRGNDVSIYIFTKLHIIYIKSYLKSY